MPDSPRAVILAAGQGTRMRSALPKVLHPLAGRPMLDHVIGVAADATGQPPIVIVSPDHAAVRSLVESRGAVAVEQSSPRGTGDALRRAREIAGEAPTLLVLNGDVPLLREATLRRLVEARADAPCALLTFRPADPSGLGRIFRDDEGRVAAIVEERDLEPGGERNTECNAGVYVFDTARLWPALEKVGSDNAQGEVYLTDVALHLHGIVPVRVDDAAEAMGVNDRVQLADAEKVVRRRILDALMRSGVTVVDPHTTYVDSAVVVGADSVIHPLTVLRGATVLGERCEIGPMAQLNDVRAGSGVVIGSSTLEDCELGDGVTIGHYDRIRPNSVLESGVSLGTHAEVKNSRIGARSRVSHFSCVLDSDVGEDVNIGAGTVTCNFDGAAKHRTSIGDGVFVGTNATLVAPLRIDDGAYVAAGSYVGSDVPAGALAVGRARQRNVEGWVARRRGVSAGEGTL